MKIDTKKLLSRKISPIKTNFIKGGEVMSWAADGSEFDEGDRTTTEHGSFTYDNIKYCDGTEVLTNGTGTTITAKPITRK